MNKKLAYILSVLYLFILQWGCSINKPVLGSIDDVFESVPEEHRGELWERMKKLEEFRRIQDWDNYFELLDKHQILNGKYSPKSKEEFIEWHKELYKDSVDFYEFIPTSARYEGDGYWWIDGCVGYGKKVIKYYKALIFAKIEEGAWLFSNCFAPYYSSDDNLLPCKEE